MTVPTVFSSTLNLHSHFVASYMQVGAVYLVELGCLNKDIFLHHTIQLKTSGFLIHFGL